MLLTVPLFRIGWFSTVCETPRMDVSLFPFLNLNPSQQQPINQMSSPIKTKITPTCPPAPIKKKPDALTLGLQAATIEEMDNLSRIIIVSRKKTDRCFQQWYAMKKDLDALHVKHPELKAACHEYSEGHFAKKKDL